MRDWITMVEDDMEAMRELLIRSYEMLEPENYDDAVYILRKDIKRELGL